MKRKFIWIMLSCLVVVALLLVSCGPAEVAEEEEEEEEVAEEEEEEEEEEVVTEEEVPEYGGWLTLYYAMVPMGERFDPFGPTASTNNFMYEGLLYGDYYVPQEVWPCQTNWHPLEYTTGWLAESWEMNDPYTWTFNLRQGVHYWDKPPANGREVVAEDYKYCAERYIPAARTSMKGGWEYVESIECPDKYTLILHMSRPSAADTYLTFNSSMGRGAILACPDVEEAYGEGAFTEWENALGTGPFMITDHVSGSSSTFARNPSYWDYDQNYPDNRLPYLDGVLCIDIADVSTRIAALRTGKIDYLTNVTWDQVASLAATNPELNIIRRPAGAGGFAMNTQIEPFNDVRVRRALQMAISQDEIVEGYYQGNAIPAHESWPMYKDWGKWSIPLADLPQNVIDIFTYNPEGAEALLDAAGYAADPATGIRFETDVYISPRFPETNDVSAILKDYWSNIGVELNIQLMESGPHESYKFSHDYPGLWAGNPFNLSGECFLWRADQWYLPEGRNNIPAWDDPVYTEKWNQSQITVDPDEQLELYKELALYILDQVPWILAPCPYSYNYWQPWVNGYWGQTGMMPMSDLNMFKHWWLDLDMKESYTGER